MRISATIFVILISTCIVNASVLDPVIENVVHFKASKPPSGVAGIWKKKTIWKPRWVKEWKSAKVMKPVWKKVWSPVQIREWVPIPKPPPGWDSISTPLAPLHPKKLQKAPVIDSAGHSSSKSPLWDPIPYPESQQPPPPPPFSQPVADTSCDKGICDNSHSGTFNHQQISEIIGPRYGTPDYNQNPEYSETVNHLTRLPPDGHNWRPPLPDPQTENPFKGFPGLPEFLVPPMFQPLPDGNFRLQPNQQPFFNPLPIPPQVSSSPAFESQNGLRQWTPFPPETKLKGHFITKPSDEPYKFQFPQLEMHIRNRTENNDNGGFRPPGGGDTVQEAQLVGEYHYSDFDLSKLKKPQTTAEEKDRVKVKPQQKGKPQDVHKQKTSHRPPAENGQRQNPTQIPLETHRPQNGPHVQKKHIPNPASNSSNLVYQQQKAILKEILPQNHRFVLPLSDDSSSSNKHHHPINVSSTLLVAVEPETGVNSSGANFLQETPQLQQTIIPPRDRFPQLSNSVTNGPSANASIIQQQKRYPVYETTAENPHNHRFSPVVNADSASNVTATRHKYYPVYETPTPFPPNHNRVPLPLDAVDSSDKSSKPDHSDRTAKPAAASGKVSKTEKPPYEKRGSVQLVFPATDEVTSGGKFNGRKLPAEDATATTTTTEPFSVIFSSSSLSKAETVTKSPVVIVTPIAEHKS